MGHDTEKRPLWAPWRIRYILGERNVHDGCFICHHAANPDDDVENHVIARGEHSFVFLNKYPYNSGHVMVSPYRHVAAMADMNADEKADCMDLLARMETTFISAMDPEGFNLGANLGTVAGAAVADHIHFHLVPRWNGDTNFMPVVGAIDCVPQALEETTELLRKHWK